MSEAVRPQVLIGGVPRVQERPGPLAAHPERCDEDPFVRVEGLRVPLERVVQAPQAFVNESKRERTHVALG